MIIKRIALLLGWALSASFLISAPIASGGNYDQEMTKIARDVATALNEQKVKSVAVLDFTDLQGTTTELGRFLAEELSTNLVISKMSFDVIDRANLNRLLDEHKLSRSGLVDPENIKRLGKIAGAYALVTGTVTPMGGKLRVSAKVISTETAKIVGAARGEIEMTDSMKELIRTRIVGNNGGAVSGQQGAAMSQKRESKPAKLTHQTKEFLATVASATYDRANNQTTVFVDFKNQLPRQRICISMPKGINVIGIDETGAVWNLKKVVGLRAADPELRAHEVRGSLVTSGASHRFALVMVPTRPESGLTLDMTIELLTSVWVNDVPCDNFNPSKPNRVTLSFDGVAAKY